jgi:hypothetical protein
VCLATDSCWLEDWVNIGRSTCVWKLPDCKNESLCPKNVSSCWEITRRGPAGRILLKLVFEAVQVGRVRVFEELLIVFNCS